MEQTLTISVCGYLIPEFSQLLNSGEYSNVKLIGFPGDCSQKPFIEHHLSKLKTKHTTTHIILGGSCISNKGQHDKNIKTIHLEPCFEVFINKEIVLDYISKGYYIVTNGWLRTYKQSIKNWGFSHDNAKSFFQESMKSILLFDTMIPGDYTTDLKALSDYMGLPYKIIPVGLSHCKMYLDSLILNWKNEVNQKTLINKVSEISKKSANYSVIFNQLEKLINLMDEHLIIQNGIELLNILFAPTSIQYIKHSHKNLEQFNYDGFRGNPNINPENSFQIEIKYTEELLGIFKINGIEFSQFKEEYEKTGVIISQLFGLAISNARKYETTIVQNKKLEIFSAELQNSNQTKDKLFSIISHDLRSPFNAILGHAELLSDEIDNFSTDKISRLSKSMYHQSAKAYGLLENILNWSRSQLNKLSPQVEVFKLRSISHETISEITDQARTKGISIDNNIDGNMEVFADTYMVKTILRNLLSNAIKFTRSNGTIALRSEIKSNHAYIYIKDTGIGIPSDRVKDIFEYDKTESTRGTNNESGTGLGLNICKEFVESNGGTIGLESEMGEGSTFHFSLPVPYS